MIKVYVNFGLSLVVVIIVRRLVLTIRLLTGWNDNSKILALWVRRIVA